MMPNPEPRIMTTAEPTLENTVSRTFMMSSGVHGGRYANVIEAMLARELLALREQVNAIQMTQMEASNQDGAWLADIANRLTALERVQRDAETGGTVDWPATAREWERIASEWRKRAETEERKLADLNAQAPEAYAASVRTVRTLTTERDAARAALRDLRSTVQLARDDLDIAQAGSEATPFARHDLLTYVATAYDRLAAALASATPAEGGERGPFVSGDEAQRFCGYCHDPVVGFLAVGHDCQHNGGHPVSGVTCPRAKSAMTPCIARDGRLALDDVTMECVGCSAQPKALMDDLAKRYPPAKAHLSSNNSLTLADRFRDRVAEYIATPAEGGDQS